MKSKKKTTKKKTTSKHLANGSQEKKSIGVMNVILVVVGISLLSFTIAMIKIFREYGAIPDTLVTCVFAALGGECGIMGWIKTNKERNRDRNWELEDRRAVTMPAQMPAQKIYEEEASDDIEDDADFEIESLESQDVSDDASIV